MSSRAVAYGRAAHDSLRHLNAASLDLLTGLRVFANPMPLLALALVLLAAFNLGRGFDAYDFVNGDTLYPIQMLDFGLLDYRPPPPNRIFPDVALHWLVQFAASEPMAQKLVVGVVLFGLTALAVGLFQGMLAFTLFAAIFVSNGFGFLVSASHYSLPLTVLIYRFAHGRRAELPLLFLLVFSNPLVLLPLAFPLTEPAALRRHAARAAIVFAALAANTLYSEFSETFIQILVVFPLWYAAVWTAGRLGVARLVCLSICLLLPVGAALGLLPARYGVAVAASALLLIFPLRRPAFDWRYVAFPAATVAIFFATADWRRSDSMHAAFDCLAGELAGRGIGVVAADHWSSKPLYFAAKARDVPLTITQTDFASNTVHAWMAPHSFYGEPTEWAVRSSDTCTLIDGSATYCGQASAAQVASVEPVCGVFELYRYETPVPANHAGVPSGKWDAIGRNLDRYIGVAMRRLNGLLSN